MSGGTGLGLEPRALAGAGTLTASLMAGEGPVQLPGADDLSVAPELRPGRLGVEAFGVSGPETKARLERVLAGEGFLVTTGHQPILFLGPLYVIYKALTAVSLARSLEARFGVPVVPMFWIASDDHDWAEVGTTRVLDGPGALHTLAIEPPDGGSKRSVGPTPLGAEIVDRVAALTELLPESEFSAQYLESIANHYQPDAPVVDGFAGLLRDVLGDRGFVWLDSSDSAVKRAAASFFSTMLEQADAVLSAADRGQQTLEEGGFEAPIGRIEGGLPLFYDDGRGRERVIQTPEGFKAGPDGTSEDLAVWLGRLDSEPDRFSPNVSSRPALESHLFPVAATVLGPGELAYWSQLPPVFEALGAPFPALQPRAAWTVIDARVRRTLDRLDLTTEALSDGGSDTIAALTEAGRPEAVTDAVDALEASIAREVDALEAAVRETVPGLEASVGKTRKRLADAVRDLGRQVDAQTRQRLDTQIGQVKRAAAALYPDRKPQERVLSPLYHLTRYGDAFVEEVAAATDTWIDARMSKRGAPS